MAEKISTSNYKDRSMGLTLFGVLEILVGVVAGFVGASVLLVGLLVKLPNAPPTPWAASFVYFGVAVVLLWLGIGSIMARRWARALLLVLSWVWLLAGIIAGATMASILPTLMDSIGGATQSAGEAQFVKTFALLFMGVIFLVMYILIPGVLILFYRSPHVKATCEVKDPKVRWTDACPLPVLAQSLVYAFGFVSLLIIMPLYRFVLPFFGTLVSGPAGALVLAVILLFLGYLAWGFYKVRIQAWWVALLFSIVWLISSLITFSKVDLMEMYQAMGLSTEQFSALLKTGFVHSDFMMVQLGLTLVLTVGYLLFVKRYFKTE